MKKQFLIISCLVLLFTIGACNGNNKQKEADQNSSVNPQGVHYIPQSDFTTHRNYNDGLFRSRQYSSSGTHDRRLNNDQVPNQAPNDQDQPQTNTENREANNLSEIQKQVIDLTNQQRKKNGLKPLQIDNQLSDVAQKKSEDMMKNNYFSHTSPTYGSPFDMMKQFGITYQTAEENIAAGQKTAEQVVTSWINSEGHRQNILNKEITHIGVGYATGGSQGPYWTQMFIRK